MKARELTNLGVPKHAVKAAIEVARRASEAAIGRHALRSIIAETVAHPEAHTDDPLAGPLAAALVEATAKPIAERPFAPRDAPAPWRQWGEDLEAKSVEQMANACDLPIAVRGALMPDAHLGYGLPIGGVLATRNAVIPYAVGVDIACRMKLSVLDLPPEARDRGADRNAYRAGAAETGHAFRRGRAARSREPSEHDVMDRRLERATRSTREKKDTALEPARHERLGQPLRRIRRAGAPARRGTTTLGLDAGPLRRRC